MVAADTVVTAVATVAVAAVVVVVVVVVAVALAVVVAEEVEEVVVDTRYINLIIVICAFNKCCHENQHVHSHALVPGANERMDRACIRTPTLSAMPPFSA